MRKFLLTSTIILVFGLYVWRANLSPRPNVGTSLAVPDRRGLSLPQAAPDRRGALALVSDAPTPAPQPTSARDPKSIATPAPPAPKPTAAPAPRDKFRDGTYRGDPADAFYGTVQVAAVVRSGRLAQIQILDYPNDRDRSIRINDYALPNLVSEAVRSQSANVDIVSGATDTSMAFRESLGSALGQALN